ncbi:MAG: putative Ig domain-containing protein [Acidobacteriota bacterium]
MAPIGWDRSAPLSAQGSPANREKARIPKREFRHFKGGDSGDQASLAGDHPFPATQLEPVAGYDLDALGVPRFVDHLYIDLYKVTRISRFRSSQGHDYSDEVESCRSMKHYFARPGPDTDLYSPVDGIITKLEPERSRVGTQVAIQADLYPAFSFILFHTALPASWSVGSRVFAGQWLGRHASQLTDSDIAVEVTDTQGRRRYVSYFDTLTGTGQEHLRSQGIHDINVLIIPRQERDAYPLQCGPDESFRSPDPIAPQWIDLIGLRAPPFTVVTSLSDLPAGVPGVSYSAPIQAIGGTPPYSWMLSWNSLPPGLMLDSLSGVISGTPSQEGDYFFGVRVTDANGATATRDLRIAVGGGAGLPDLTFTNLVAPTQGSPGGGLEVSAIMKNVGKRATGSFKVHFYLSLDSNLTTADLDTGFECDRKEGLPSDGAFVCEGTLVVPSSISTGTYYLGAVLDTDERVDESNETNNVRVSDEGPIQLVAAGSPVSATLFVPIVLSSAGLNQSFFTSELVLTNRGPLPAGLTYTYTQAFGGGSGTAIDTLGPGRQLIVPDAIAYLKSLGMLLPESGNRGGTLAVRFDGLASASEAGVTVRTTTAVSNGRAGLAYVGVPPSGLLDQPVYLCGLRHGLADRSNLAVQHAGDSSSGEIGLRLTVFDGESTFSQVLPTVTLAPGGFSQISGILRSPEMNLSSGYVRVERVSGSAPFFAYAVINDQANSDGSFIAPIAEHILAGRPGLTLPVIVETASFSSELVVTNWSSRARTVRFDYRSNQVETAEHVAVCTLDVPAGRQVIIPEMVQALRQAGIPGIGPPGNTFAGALFARIEGEDISGLSIGARTSTAGGGGRFGLFYSAVPYGQSSIRDAWLFGLQQNDENRTNLAIVNTGEVDSSSATYQIELYDGRTGSKVADWTLSVPAGGWTQIGSVLAPYGVPQGYARIRRISGNNPFLAYSVVNDGGRPNERSGDGAFVTSAY